MGRLRCKTGCVTCRTRKKKCDERRPFCDACTRLHVPCTYDRKWPVYRGSVQVIYPTALTTFEPSTQVGGSPQKVSFDLIQRSASTFLTPLTDDSIREFKHLLQMAWHDSLVRHSLIVCFTRTLGSTPDFGPLDCQTYGDVLSALRNRLATVQPTVSQTLPLQVAMTFLGVLKTTGPSETDNLLQHFNAMAALLKLTPPAKILSLPSHESELVLLTLETMAYYTTVAMFSQNLDSVYKLWKASGVFHLLQRLNPEGPERVSRSPFLSGQYAVYSLVLEVTYLHRLPESQRPSPDSIDRLELLVLQLRSSVVTDFRGDKPGCMTVYQRLFSDIYELYIGCLIICVDALREPNEAVRQRIDTLAMKYISHLSNIPIIKMCYAAVAWPTQMLACAVRHNADFEPAELWIEKIKMLLDSGHLERLEATLALLKTVRRESTDQVIAEQSPSIFLPPGLSLLRKKNGVLT